MLQQQQRDLALNRAATSRDKTYRVLIDFAQIHTGNSAFKATRLYSVHSVPYKRGSFFGVISIEGREGK